MVNPFDNLEEQIMNTNKARAYDIITETQNEQLEKLQSQLIQGNWLLLEMLPKLNETDKAFFSPKVEGFIKNCRLDLNKSK